MLLKPAREIPAERAAILDIFIEKFFLQAGPRDLTGAGKGHEVVEADRGEGLVVGQADSEEKIEEMIRGDITKKPLRRGTPEGLPEQRVEGPGGLGDRDNVGEGGRVTLRVHSDKRDGQASEKRRD